MACTGIFGGTFDPIHYGHLRTAFELLQALRLDAVRFIPCGDPPHRDQTMAPADVRLSMVEHAVGGQTGFIVDDREVRRDGPSYSVETLEALREEMPEQPLAIIIGMDAFLGLTSWHRWVELLDFAHIIVAHRPGWRAPDMGPLGELIERVGTHRVEDLHDAANGRIHIHAVTQLEISSTDIRDLIAGGRDPRFLMPDAVRSFIAERGCYRGAA